MGIMRRVCRICQKEMEPIERPDGAADSELVSHGICSETCMRKYCERSGISYDEIIANRENQANVG